MKRKLATVISILLLVSIVLPVCCNAFERGDHDTQLVEVLFPKDYEIKRQPVAIQNAVHALRSSAYLAIDQYNGNGQDDLDFLIGQEILGIPQSISSFDFTSNGKTHRSFTHRGWGYSYSDDRAHWKKRKEILLKTVNQVFDFGSESNAISGYSDKCDSFAALVYYIHIIGDHNDDDSFKKNNGLKMDLGGRKDKQDIIDELLYHFDILFSDQRFSPRYLLLVTKLNSLNRRMGKLVQSTGGINTDEKFEQYHKLGEDLFKTLKRYVPYLLEKEEFFAAVFYPGSMENAA